MAGGCWVCNPMCGKCQPAPKKSFVCPACGTCTIFDRFTQIQAGARLVCRKCGLDVTESVRPKPVTCNFSGLMCAYPCGKATSADAGKPKQKCLKNTPASAVSYLG